MKASAVEVALSASMRSFCIIRTEERVNGISVILRSASERNDLGLVRPQTRRPFHPPLRKEGAHERLCRSQARTRWSFLPPCMDTSALISARPRAGAFFGTNMLTFHLLEGTTETCQISCGDANTRESATIISTPLWIRKRADALKTTGTATQILRKLSGTDQFAQSEFKTFVGSLKDAGIAFHLIDAFVDRYRTYYDANPTRPRVPTPIWRI
ncbi:MAG: hypothetical protein WDM89_20425 [Rhizomicrobium sp.]